MFCSLSWTFSKLYKRRALRWIANVSSPTGHLFFSYQQCFWRYEVAAFANPARTIGLCLAWILGWARNFRYLKQWLNCKILSKRGRSWRASFNFHSSMTISCIHQNEAPVMAFTILFRYHSYTLIFFKYLSLISDWIHFRDDGSPRYSWTTHLIWSVFNPFWSISFKIFANPTGTQYFCQSLRLSQYNYIPE